MARKIQAEFVRGNGWEAKPLGKKKGWKLKIFAYDENPFPKADCFGQPPRLPLPGEREVEVANAEKAADEGDRLVGGYREAVRHFRDQISRCKKCSLVLSCLAMSEFFEKQKAE